MCLEVSVCIFGMGMVVHGLCIVNVLHVGRINTCAFVCMYVFENVALPSTTSSVLFVGGSQQCPLTCVSYIVLRLNVADSQQNFKAWVQWDNIPSLLSLWLVALTEPETCQHFSAHG